MELEEARARVLAAAAPLGSEPVALAQALGRVLAETVTSAEDVPGFDNSAMDGYAVRAADVGGASPDRPASLARRGESRARAPAAAAVGPGEAIAISTGAMIPAGADAVVRIEDTEAAPAEVRVLAPVAAAANLRSIGEDIRAGSVVLTPGTVLGPAEMGVLASVGAGTPTCARRPRVAVLSTGDELLAPDERMRPGGVRNSNAHTVPALVRQAGADPVSVEMVGDDAAATQAAVGRALCADVAVVCGGVSVGRHDHVRGALAELGAEEEFWGVGLRPGKPTWFGRRDRCLAFGLPGNPVSALVTFILFVRPALLAMSGVDPAAARTQAVLTREVPKKPGRAHAVRCRLTPAPGGWQAEPTGPQGSHVLTSMLGADCLAILPADSADVAAGARVEIELLPRPLGIACAA